MCNYIDDDVSSMSCRGSEVFKGTQTNISEEGVRVEVR